MQAITKHNVSIETEKSVTSEGMPQDSVKCSVLVDI